ncbi:MAG TPA: hypothetical protein VHC22_17285, partial [Pirellulales bacterium]|nr:hypothetical protein [Pirellulales bacterium]
MRSIPQAMFWELWRHGRWHLLAGLLGAYVLSVVLFGALRHDGAVNPRDPSQIGMHIVLLQLNALIFGMGMAAAQGRPARLYALPVPTSSLVFWHLLPLIVAVAAESG